MASLIRKIVNHKITKALKEFSMIEENDRILIAASGGKDSTVLLLELANRYKILPRNITLTVIYIQSDFGDLAPLSLLQDLQKKINLTIAFHFLKINISGRLKENRKLNCFWCATQRRTELLNFAIKNHYNKIALGHHMDDIIETMLLNMLYKGEISGMAPVLKYDKYPVSIIRPLCYCEEKEIEKYIKDANIATAKCTCACAQNSNRLKIKDEIKTLTQNNSTLKYNLLRCYLKEL